MPAKLNNLLMNRKKELISTFCLHFLVIGVKNRFSTFLKHEKKITLEPWPAVSFRPLCPAVLQGQPRFALPVRFVEQVLLHKQEIRFPKRMKQRTWEVTVPPQNMPQNSKIYTTAQYSTSKKTHHCSPPYPFSVHYFVLTLSFFSEINTNEKYYNKTNKTPQNVDKERLYEFICKHNTRTSQNSIWRLLENRNSVMPKVAHAPVMKQLL